VARSIGLGVALFGFWLLLSGIYTPLLIILGIFSSALVAWIAHRMNVADHEGFPIHATRALEKILKNARVDKEYPPSLRLRN
jgi:multicomponent Na+:H+ antiporter subunit E